MMKSLLVLLIAGISLLLLPKSAAAQGPNEIEAMMQAVGYGFIPVMRAACKNPIGVAVAAKELDNGDPDTNFDVMVPELLFVLTEKELPGMLADIAQNSKTLPDVVRCMAETIFKIRQPGKAAGAEVKSACKTQLDAARGKMKEPADPVEFTESFIPQFWLFFNDKLLAEMGSEMAKDSPQAGAVGRCASAIIANRKRGTPNFVTFVEPSEAEVTKVAQSVLPELQGSCLAEIRALPAPTPTRGARGTAAAATNPFVLEVLGKALFKITDGNLGMFAEVFYDGDNLATKVFARCAGEFALKRNKEKGPVPQSMAAVIGANAPIAAAILAAAAPGTPNILVPAPVPAPAPVPGGTFTINVVRTLGDGCIKVQAAGTVASGNVFETTLELRNTCPSIELVEVLGSANGTTFSRGGTWIPRDGASDPTIPVAADRKVAPRPTAAALGFTPMDNALGGAYFRMSGNSVMERKVRHPEANAKIDAVLASCRTWENDVEPYIAYRDANATVFVCKPYLQMPGTN